MSILVIGNGFDLAHGLRTKYSHFLDFVKAYKNEDGCSDDALVNQIRKFKSDGGESAKQTCDIISKSNKLLDYFLEVYGKRCSEGKDGWIDFESEISEIVQYFEAARSEEHNNRRLISTKLLGKLRPFISAYHDGATSSKSIHYSQGFVEEQAKNLLSDLNDITRLLEIYLIEFVEKKEVEKRIPEIQTLGQVTGVLSFNYTNTFAKLYDGEKTEYCFIHGQTKENCSVEECNLVLGIDEYLTGGKEDTDNALIWFKKFYQRIYKETSSSYIDWLDKHSKMNAATSKQKPKILDIYYFGHSLNITDKDVLQTLLLHPNAKNHIFYMDRADMASKIQNLVAIIQEENLIQLTRGTNRTIEFLKIGQ